MPPLFLFQFYRWRFQVINFHFTQLYKKCVAKVDLNPDLCDSEVIMMTNGPCFPGLSQFCKEKSWVPGTFSIPGTLGWLVTLFGKYCIKWMYSRWEAWWVVKYVIYVSYWPVGLHYFLLLLLSWCKTSLFLQCFENHYLTPHKRVLWSNKYRKWFSHWHIIDPQKSHNNSLTV